MKAITIILSLITGTLLYANEPLWSDKERMDNRKAVISGTVKEIEKIKDQKTPKVQLMRATISVDKVEKGSELIEKKTIVIYYEKSPLRKPRLPILTEGDSGRFYLRRDTGLTDEVSFVLELASDVQINPAAEQDTAPNR